MYKEDYLNLYNYNGLDTYFSVSRDILIVKEVKDVLIVVEVPDVTSVEKNRSMLFGLADLGRRVGRFGVVRECVFCWLERLKIVCSQLL